MSNTVCDVREHIPNAVYIGRRMPRQRLAGSLLGNPFKIGPDGDRRDVLRRYSAWLCKQVMTGDRAVIDALIACRDRPLACWCRTSDAVTPWCHGDIIAALLDEFSDDELRAFAEADAR